MSRLVIDPNRRPGTPTSIPEISDGCVVPGNQRLDLPTMVDRVIRYFLPYHRAVARRIGQFRRQGFLPAVIAVHSFTPVMNGEVRNADIGLLYDSRRAREGAFCARWLSALRRADPSVRVRRNYPYLGKADGLATALRQRYPQSRYIGVELEINQALVGAPAWKRFQQRVADSLRDALS